MKDNDVAQISEQFGIAKEIVEASIEDGTLSQRISDAMKNQVVYKTKDEFENFKVNYKADVVTNYFNELVEKAKKGDVPQDLYAPIKGSSYQQLERDLSKKFGVEKYKDVNDLIDQVVKTSANGNKGQEELLHQLEELKTANIKLQEEKENAVSNVRSEYQQIALEREKKAFLDNVPFDLSNVKPEELPEAKAKIQRLLSSVFDAEHKLTYNDKNNVVVLKGDEVLKSDTTFDPIPPQDVFIKLAKEYNLKLKSPDSGGQGGSSSAHSQGTYASVEDFEADMKAKGIPTTSKDYINRWVKSGLSNKK